MDPSSTCNKLVNFFADHEKINKVKQWRKRIPRQEASDFMSWYYDVIAHIDELKKILCDNFYLCTHGQPGRFLALSILSKELMKLNNKGNNELHTCQKVMRHVDLRPKIFPDLAIYSEKNFCDWLYSKELVSVDVNFMNREDGESAFSIASKGESRICLNSETGLKKNIEEIVKTTVSEEGRINTFVEKIFKTISTNPIHSNVWLFAIPKNLIRNQGYLCKKYGVLAEPWKNPEEGIKILDELQQGEIRGVEVSPNDISNYQFRLFSSKLQEPGILSFHCPETTTTNYKKLKNEICSLAKEIHEI